MRYCLLISSQIYWIIFLADTQYVNVVSDWKSWDDDGTSPIRILVYAIPTILSLFGIKYIKNEDDPVINMATNAGIISTALGIISMKTSGVFMGRLPIYVSLYSSGILLPWELNHMFTRNSARLIKIVAIIMYIAFFIIKCILHGDDVGVKKSW